MSEPMEPFDSMKTGDTLTAITKGYFVPKELRDYHRVNEGQEYELQYLGTTESELELMEWSHNFTDSDGEIRQLQEDPSNDIYTLWTKRPNYDYLKEKERKYEPVLEVNVDEPWGKENG